MHTDSGAVRLMAGLAARAILACLGTMVLWSLLPLALGWHSSVVMTGSMEPSIRPGDVVVTRAVPVSGLRVRQVAQVPDPDHAGRLRLHRIDEIRADGRLVLRGDANRTADSSLVDAGDVLGVGTLRVPLVGTPARALRTGHWAQLAAMAISLVLLVALAGNRGPRGPRARPPRAPAGRDRIRPRWSQTSREPPVRGRVARRWAVVALIPLLVMWSGPSGFAAFKLTATSPTSQFTSAASFYPYRDAVLTDTPVLYWRLGEASGTTAANTASTGPAGIYYSTPALGQPSALSSEVVNKSISTTTSGFVTASTAVTAPAQFTIEAWIKTTSTAGGRVFGFGNGATTTLSTTVDRQLYLSPTGKAVAGLRNATLVKTVATSPLSYNDGQWHYLAATYNGTVLRLYVDSTLVASTTTTATTTFSGYWRAATENLTGWPTAPSGNNYAGGLDELAVYATALSATRISAHYTAATS